MEEGPAHSALSEIKVKVHVVLPTVAVGLDELLELGPGTLLRLGVAGRAVSELVVNGRRLAAGEVVSRAGSRALAVKEVL